MNKEIKDFTDLELAKTSGQLYQQLMLLQNNLLSVAQEIEKRTPKEQVKDEPRP